MNYQRALLIVGFLIILIPFIGVPLTWKYALTILLGALVIGFTILLRSSLKLGKKVVTPRTPRARAPRARRSTMQSTVVRSSLRNTLVEEEPVVPVITSESLIESEYDKA